MTWRNSTMATILLIDDDPKVRQMLEALLCDDHECHTADRAEQAIELIEFQKYDVVITDVSMPGLGGLEVLRRIKQRQPVPVIVISGRADQAGLNVSQGQCISTCTKASAECTRLKRAVLVGGHSARLTIPKRL